MRGKRVWEVASPPPEATELPAVKVPDTRKSGAGIRPETVKQTESWTGWVDLHMPLPVFSVPPTPYILLCSHRPLQQSGTRASALKKILLESSKPGDIKYSVIQGKWKCMGRVSTHKEDGDMPGILFYQPTTANILPSGRTLFFLDKLGGPKKRKPLDIEIWKSLRKMLSSPLTLVWMPTS